MAPAKRRSPQAGLVPRQRPDGINYTRCQAGESRWVPKGDTPLHAR